ncbi:phosphoserine phosphatase [Bradyrhizobium sp. USDA 4472]
MPKRTTEARPELKLIDVGAAAIDIGSRLHRAAVNPTDSNDAAVRSFGTFTQNLHDLADWFKACGVTSVAMDSTGSIGIPVYEILEQRGFDVIFGQCALRQERSWTQDRRQRRCVAARASFLWPLTWQLPILR